jgi:hypothetical protein
MELDGLCCDERLQPITYNHYYTDNIQNARQAELKNFIRASFWIWTLKHVLKLFRTSPDQGHRNKDIGTRAIMAPQSGYVSLGIHTVSGSSTSDDNNVLRDPGSPLSISVDVPLLAFGLGLADLLLFSLVICLCSSARARSHKMQNQGAMHQEPNEGGYVCLELHEMSEQLRMEAADDLSEIYLPPPAYSPKPK